MLRCHNLAAILHLLFVDYARSVLINHSKLIITTPYHGYLKNLALSVLINGMIIILRTGKVVISSFGV